MDCRVFNDVPVGGYFAVDGIMVCRKISATKIRIFGENSETKFINKKAGVKYYGETLNSFLSHTKLI